jgi:hypothetical protein
MNNNRSLSEDQRLMIHNYIRQYNQANNQINHLYSVLADLRHSIDNIYNQSNHHVNNTHSNRHSYRSSNRQNRRNNIDQFDFNFYNIPLNTYANYQNTQNNLLTSQEIEAYTFTSLFINMESPINTECPIRLEEFNMDDVVTRIRRCGHIFNTQELNNWLLSNTRCPVCRCEIRNNNSHTNNSQTNPSQSISETYDYSTTLINQLLTGLFNDYAIVRDASNNIINDTSGNIISDRTTNLNNNNDNSVNQ